MKEIISKFLAPVFFILLGLLIVIVGTQQGQNGMVLIGGGAFALTGVVALFNALGFINKMISIVIIVVMIGVTGILGFMNYRSIKAPIEYNKKKDKIYAGVVQRLKDIREAQIAYKKEYGEYTSSFDTLIHFIKHDSIKTVKMTGFVPDGKTEAQALADGDISRDTVKLPAYDNIYTKEYVDMRYKVIPLVPDSLPFVPYGKGSTYEMETNKIMRNSMLVPVIEIRDSKPFDPNEPMIVGSLDEPRTSGNWKEER
ncbi:MAG: hypothetical protein CL843_05635 [Crocinitomicaceae bacterium]|nr:hypothetical protein [Crocinitomicaceae bacterium]|tara:strand:+ start:1867 stop:2631 length:765 start_codon:yes stop_codon:yes gene_type:complete